MRVARIIILNLLIVHVIMLWLSMLNWDRPSEKKPPATPRLTSLEKKTGVEAHGLRISVNALLKAERKLKVSYVFQWVERPEDESQFYFLHPWGMLDVHFWDSVGNPIIKSLQGEFICPDFVSARTNLHMGEFCVPPPRGARYLSIGFARAGMMTPKTEIPQWWLLEIQNTLTDLRNKL